MKAKSSMWPTNVEVEGTTTGFIGFAESEMLSTQGQFPSAEPAPRGSSRHSALGTV
jgi:hypothetical protein